ncbi:MAG: flagellar hook-basal body complex protein, partial [Planctomycetota bacterium]
NPQQMGHGVGVAGITPNMAQGNIVNTGNPLDLAIEGEGYFVLNDGEQDLYTRAGAFAVDADSRLVDPSTGNIVQRIGTVGEADGFQIPGDTNVRVPYDISMPAKSSTEVRVSGNLSADAALAEPQTNALTSNIIFTAGGSPAGVSAKISELDQYIGTTWVDGTFTFSGYKSDGTLLGSAPTTDLTMPVDEDTTLDDVLTWLNTDDGMSNEKQTLSDLTGPITAGTFNVAFGGDNVDINWDDDATEVKTALETLSSIDVGDVIVTGGALPGTDMVVEFTGQYSGTDVALMVIDNTNLTGGTMGAAETKQGTKAINEKQTVTITGTPTGGTFTLDLGTGTPASVAWDANAAAVKAALVTLDGITTNDVDVTGGALPGTPVVIEFIGALDGTDIDMLTIDTSGLTGGTSPSGSVAETVKGRGLQGILGSDATASLVNGKIRITDADSGYSQSDFKMAWSDANLTVPAYFEVTTVGGEEIKNINITVYDSQGGKHVLAGAFVRTDTPNMWDMVLTSISGDITEITFDNRRIDGMTFYANNGSFKGLDSTIADTADLAVTFAHDIANPQTITMSMGTTGQFNGLTQFKGNSTAVAREQDGYAAGSFSAVSVNNEGILIGVFTNGIKKDLAAMKLALFQNPSALETVGNGYYIASANSGEAVATQALTGGAGSIHGGALEKSNADVANEFVSMIQAQNGFQANAKTIKIANDILRDLTNLIR